MPSEDQAHGLGSGLAGRRQFSWPRLALWLPTCLVLAVLLAWAAVVGQSYIAPLLLYPLLVGVGLGAVLVVVMRLGQVGNWATVLLGTILAAGVTVVGQHYIAYATAYRGMAEKAAMQQPFAEGFSDLVWDWRPSFAEFMRRQASRGRTLADGYVARGWLAWLSWAVDGLLLLGATLAIVVPAARLPYCDRCRSWYRVTRSGRIEVPAARRLAEVAGMATAAGTAASAATAARYRLHNCLGGCGPTQLQLSWDRSPRGTLVLRRWLDTERRAEIVRILDGEEAVDGGR
jgi:hypothetical protein